MLGVASHAPGGLGVFEATILLALSSYPREPVLGALLLYPALLLSRALRARAGASRRLRDPNRIEPPGAPSSRTRSIEIER